MEILTKKVDSAKYLNQSKLGRQLYKYMTTGGKYAKNIFIAGGFARHLYNPSLGYDDIDIYIKGMEERFRVTQDIQNFLFRSSVPIDVTTPNNVCTLGVAGETSQPKLQIIDFKSVNSVDELFESYDFTCCMFALFGDSLVYTKQAEQDTKSKTLRWGEGILKDVEGVNKINRFWRIEKYLKKGFTFAEGEGDKFFEMEWADNFRAIAEQNVRNSSSNSDRVFPAIPVPEWPVELDEPEPVSSSTEVEQIQVTESDIAEIRSWLGEEPNTTARGSLQQLRRDASPLPGRVTYSYDPEATSSHQWEELRVGEHSIPTPTEPTTYADISERETNDVDRYQVRLQDYIEVFGNEVVTRAINSGDLEHSPFSNGIFLNSDQADMYLRQRARLEAEREQERLDSIPF